MLLLDVSARGALPTADPACHCGQIAAAGSVNYGRADAILSSQDCFEGTAGEVVILTVWIGSGRSLGLALLNVLLLLAPAAVAELPGEPRGANGYAVTFDRVAVDIGDHKLDREGLALFDKVAVCAQADVAVGRMQEEVGAAGPGLAVDVKNGCRGIEVDGEIVVGAGGFTGREVYAQVVFAGEVGA